MRVDYGTDSAIVWEFGELGESAPPRCRAERWEVSRRRECCARPLVFHASAEFTEGCGAALRARRYSMTAGRMLRKMMAKITRWKFFFTGSRLPKT